MNLLFDIIGLCLLALPLAWEVYNDKDGDDGFANIFPNLAVKQKEKDVGVRVGIAIAAAWLNALFNGINFWSSLGLSGAIHFLFFDYIVAYLLIQNGVIDHVYNHWFSYLGSKSGFDNISFWKSMDPVFRLIVRVLVFLAACYMYLTV